MGNDVATAKQPVSSKYVVQFGLDEEVKFDILEHATIFTIGLTAKGESYTMFKEKSQ